MNSEFFELRPKKYTTKLQLYKRHDKAIVFRHGHIAITDYHMGDNPEFEKALSVWNETRWRYELKGGYYVAQLHEFRVNRGYEPAMLGKFFPGYTVVVENDAYPADKVKIDLLCPPRDDFQRVALTFMCCQGEYTNNARYTQQLIDAETGDGKAMPNDTMIPTPKGLRRLDSLKVGDEVFNLDGEPVKVLAIYPQKGKQDTYEVTFKDGRKTRCNGEHLWYVHYKSLRNHRFTALTLNDIAKDYIVKLPGNRIMYKYVVPVPGAVQYDEQDVPVDPYVLGVLIGNGCLSELPLTISSGNMDVPKEVSRRLGYPTHLRMYGNYSYRFIVSEKDGHKKYLQTKEFLKSIPELIDSKSGDKFIPDMYLYNSIDVRMELLRGLLDSDGHITKDKYQISYTTTSQMLKDDIVALVRSLGFIAYVGKDSRDTYKSGVCYKIQITCPDKVKSDLFLVHQKKLKRAIKGAETYKTKKCNTLQITNIEKVKSTKQRCILIDDPRHVYIAENYIPTHNTYLGTATPCFMSARSVIIVPFSKLLEQWKNSFLTFTSLKEDEILIVQGSSICKKIINGEYPDVKVFIFLVDTIDAFHKKHGDLETIELLRATNAYIKIVDEIHRDMKIISMIEALSNFHMNFYMSASPGRTQKKENWIFKTCFKNLPKFGSGFKVKEERHLNIIVKRYRFTPTPAQIKRMVHPQKKWLNSKSYERELIHAPDEQKADFINSLKAMLKWSKGLLKKGNKILILSDTVEGTEFTNNIANEIFPNQTARYYGAMKDADKKKALEATVICATVLSLGTGADIPGIQHVYNITTYSSQISAIQTAGRARKLKDGTMVFYIELVNMSYLKTFRQYEARKPNLIKKSKTGKIMLID